MVNHALKFRSSRRRVRVPGCRMPIIAFYLESGSGTDHRLAALRLQAVFHDLLRVCANLSGSMVVALFGKRERLQSLHAVLPIADFLPTYGPCVSQY